MNPILSKYLFYYPVTLAKGELVAFYLPKYRRFQYQSAESIRQHQCTHLKKLLKYTSKNVPFYQQRLAGIEIDKINATNLSEILVSIPTLTKQDLIEQSHNLQTNYTRWPSRKTTGGSTGEPVTLLKNPGALARERAATWRGYEWAGISIGDMQARFWGTPHSRKDHLKAKLIDFVANRIRISAFNLSEESLLQYYQRMKHLKPSYLYGYVSVIEAFANFLHDHNLEPISSLRAIITTSEVLTENIRHNIQQALNLPVFNEYGCGEVGSIAHECEYHGMHLMADNLIVETEGEGNSGELIVTDLFNYSMPLIRYKLGDFATLSDKKCSCGRGLPLIEKIHGRAYDLIKTSNGITVHPESVMYIFENIQQQSKSFKHFQAIQTALNHFDIKVVPTNNWNNETSLQIEKGLQAHLSPDISISIELVDQISREKSGKMRVVKSTLTP